MKNILFATGILGWFLVGSRLALHKSQQYQLQHPAPKTVAASKYQAVQQDLAAQAAQYKVLAANHATVCASLKVKPKGC